MLALPAVVVGRSEGRHEDHCQRNDQPDQTCVAGLGGVRLAAIRIIAVRIVAVRIVAIRIVAIRAIPVRIVGVGAVAVIAAAVIAAALLVPAHGAFAEDELLNINTATVEQLAQVPGLNEELAKAITDEIRKGNPMDTTTALREVIEKTLDFLPEKEKKETIKKTCQRTFQALRIDVNREFEVLYEFMEKLPGALKPGGRAAILTFHSGEDKLVKKALKAGYKEGIYSDYSRDVIRPSAEECAKNGRAKSTKLRWAVKAQE